MITRALRMNDEQLGGDEPFLPNDGQHDGTERDELDDDEPLILTGFLMFYSFMFLWLSVNNGIIL